MTATAHALIGGAIAAGIPDPTIGLPLSFISHPLLDMVPHWDFGWGWRDKSKFRFFTEASLDLILGATASFLVFGHFVSLPYFLASVFLAVSWDLAEVPYHFLSLHFPPFSTIYKSQSFIQGKAKLPWGVITQIISVGAVLFALRLL